MRKSLLCLLLAAFSGSVFSQSVEEIKADRATWLWGEGNGLTLDKADQQALGMLISQISVAVESRFSILKEELQKSGKSDLTEECRQMVTTYSSAMLNNTERLILSGEPDARVFRYMKREDIARVFSQRKDKILDFTRNGDNALKEMRLADALKYYYWALTLLRSHPDGETITTTLISGEQARLFSYLPERINTIFNGIRFSTGEIHDEQDIRTVTLKISFHGEPVGNLDYCYWEGRNYSSPVSAKDGTGFMEFYGTGTENSGFVQLKIEYIFAGEARIDREIDEALQRLDPIPFPGSYITIDLRKSSETPGSPIPDQLLRLQKPMSVNTNSSGIFAEIPEETSQSYKKIVGNILEAVRKHDYQADSSLFTPEGYDVYRKLIGYGRAKILVEDTVRLFRVNDRITCRGVRMAFSFQNNPRNFVEDVVFHFTPEGKIGALSFGLGEKSLESILSKKSWSEAERMTLIHFLEHYRTAYALKRLDYINSIFSEDAVIITGSVLKIKPDADNPFRGNSIVRYNRYNKEQYLKALKHTFAGNEFINVAFEECNIRKGGKNGDLFGIQIRQNYFSSTYGDQGWLFLLIDFQNQDEPLIHVRTWQPTIEKDSSVYGIEDF